MLFELANAALRAAGARIAAGPPRPVLHILAEDGYRQAAVQPCQAQRASRRRTAAPDTGRPAYRPTSRQDSLLWPSPMNEGTFYDAYNVTVA